MRTKIPFDTGPIHFVGIGGIGMSGIAEVLINLGYAVQGSDIKKNANVQRLERKGARIFIGHRAENVSEAGAVVVSSAIKRGNPEVDQARDSHIPVVRRAEMLAELMRLRWSVAVAGTHGKTTTTSLIAALLEAGQRDPTVINGGIINAYGANAKLGKSDWMVVEADESDGSFLKLFPTVAVITNMDAEHLDHYGSFEGMRDAYDHFVENLPFYGFGILCLDHPNVQALAARITDRRILTYGFNPQADYRIENWRCESKGCHFDSVYCKRGDAIEQRLLDLFLPMAGKHNISNAMAAIVVASELGLSETEIRQGLAGFGGVKRRFSPAGSWNGARFIDDYAHHPVEIKAVLSAARQQAGNGQVVAVVQPHRYSRLQDLFDEFCSCFNDADKVLVMDVFAAGEAPIDGMSKEGLVRGLIRAGHKDAHFVEGWDQLSALLKQEVGPGDLVIFCGAGDITVYANEMAQKLLQTAA